MCGCHAGDLLHGLGRRSDEYEIRVFHFQKMCEAAGAEHPSTLTSFNNLASVLTDQAKYEEAEEMHRQALGLGETVLAKEHPSTLMSLHCLTHLLHLQQRPNEAGPLYQRTLTGYDKTLGSDHSTTQACRKSYLFISKGMDELDTKV